MLSKGRTTEDTVFTLRHGESLTCPQASNRTQAPMLQLTKQRRRLDHVSRQGDVRAGRPCWKAARCQREAVRQAAMGWVCFIMSMFSMKKRMWPANIIYYDPLAM